MRENNKNFEIIGKTFSGLEDVFSNELKDLGAKNIQILRRGIKFTGSKELLYRVNYRSRLSLRFLMTLISFKAANENILYKKVYEYPWESIFSFKQTIFVTSTVNSTIFKHSHYVSLKVKDAIVDRFRDKMKQRPNVDKSSPNIVIHIHISNDLCNLSLDSSGEPLYKRGYRIAASHTPLNEVLAAGLVYLSGWNKSDILIDFMCGSGTILIEAALIAGNIPTGKLRNNYAFQNWNNYEEDLFNFIKNEKVNNNSYVPTILGCDISPDAIGSALKNINKAGLSSNIKIQNRNYLNFKPPKKKGVVITNPPYNVRLKDNDILLMYKELGDYIKRAYTGYDVWILSHNIQALKNIGLKASAKYQLYNGPLECKYNKYSIFEGSLKKN
ncbi:MAG: RNA methyltransferase [Bacteroidales bacterium]|nr:RNA methyltransferase [Bacteroidales bacterium]